MFQDAVEEIGEAIPRMTPQQQKVGKYFYEHPELLGVLSLKDFAERIGTSGPSVNRFCTSLGYGGFLDFSRIMKRLRNNEISHAAFFRSARISHDKNKGGLGIQLLKKEIRQLERLAENYPAEKIAKCVELMQEAASILIIGKMSVYPAALYFEQSLGKVTSKLVPMTVTDITQATEISRLDKNSLVFCVAFPRYPRSVLDLARIAKHKCSTIVAITQNGASPLAELSDLLFSLDVEIFAYLDLLIPVYALIDAICLEFSLSQPDQSEKSLVKYDRIVENTFFSSGKKGGAKMDTEPE